MLSLRRENKMAIQLSAGKKEVISCGRNFVLNANEKRVLDLENQRINVSRVSPLSKRITARAKKQIMDIALDARNKFLSKQITKMDLMIYAIVEMDKFIINQLPVTKEAKLKAIKSQEREAMLSNLAANSSLGTIVTQAKALSLIRESEEILKQLEPIYKKVISREGADTKLANLLHKVKASKTGEYNFTPADIIMLKIINTANTRQILGEEMGTVYQQCYTAAKMDLVQTMIKIFS